MMSWLCGEKAVCHLREVLHTDVFDRWIAVIEPGSMTDDQLVLKVDNDFYQTWLEEHYLPLIQDAVASVSGSRPQISFIVGQQSSSTPVEEKQPTTTERIRRHFTKRPKNAPQLNAKFTFDDFVVGPCNNFAHAASLAVSQSPARAYNPLFVYGGVGLGKTHLMQAIGHYVMDKSRATVCYLSSEEFTNQYINALQTRSIVQFRKKYRNTDLLLIDDIHFLAGKERLQEEFFHTFNTLFDAHRQVVMTSDKPASEIVGLEQRLVSRFEWGLVTEMEAPDLETRMAILRQQLGKSGASLGDHVVLFIAEKIRSNIRRLEGALTRAISYGSLTGHDLTMEALQHLLRDMIDDDLQENLTCSTIQKTVAQHYDIRLADMVGTRRSRAISGPRQVAMYLCRKLTDSSLPQIGASFNRTHATVLHACRNIEKKLPDDPELKRTINGLAKQLGKSI